MRRLEQDLNHTCSNAQKLGIFLNAVLLPREATGLSCNCPGSAFQGVSCTAPAVLLNNAFLKLQFALISGASPRFLCVTDDSP